MENPHFKWENSLQMTIFNSYVKLPKRIWRDSKSLHIPRDSYGFPLGFLGAKIPSIPMVDEDHYDPLPWQVAGAGIDVETSISAQQQCLVVTKSRTKYVEL